MKKRQITIIVLIALCLLVTGCTDRDSKETEAVAKPSASTETSAAEAGESMTKGPSEAASVAEDPETMEPSDVSPGTTEPQATEPPATTAPATQPTQPAATEPQATEPQETDPVFEEPPLAENELPRM